MSSRTCAKCKAETLPDYRGSKCKVCRNYLDLLWCYHCTQFLDAKIFIKRKSGIMMTYCNPCRTKILMERYYSKENYAKYATKKFQAMEDRMEQLLKVPDGQFKPMSESEWLETCKYFDGCALCSDPHVETRQFLIPFKAGGQYAPWNVLPMCGECSTVARVVDNPFRWLRKHGYAERRFKLTEERRKLIEDYFIAKVSERREQQDNGV